MQAKCSAKGILRVPNQVRKRGVRIYLSNKGSTNSPLSLKETQEHTNAFVTYTSPFPAEDTNSSSLVHGQPIAIKDNICTRSFKTTCGSAMLQDFASPYDATVVDLLRDGGAKVIGKTNCDEFGMGSLNVNSVHGPVINPFQVSGAAVPWEQRERRSAGGSSGGSAAAVASGACYAALGTDTGGSVRLPAAYCGVVGFKPSYGMISRWGVVSYADSLDCVGVIANNVDAVSRVFHTLAHHDPKDPTCASGSIRQEARAILKDSTASLPWDFRGQRLEGLESLRIGVPKDYFPQELDPSSLKPFRQLLQRIRSSGAEIVPVSLPSTRYALSTYYVIASAEASSNLARYTGVHYGLQVVPPKDFDKTKTSNVYALSRTKGFGHEVQKRILLGTYALTADAFDNYFLQAQRTRKLIKRDFDRVFRAANPLRRTRSHSQDGVDVLLHPSAVGTAPLLENADAMNELEAYVQDVLTVPASLAGLPALSVPVGFGEDGWPLGVSVVGQWGQDDMVLNVGAQIQKSLELPQ